MGADIKLDTFTTIGASVSYWGGGNTNFPHNYGYYQSTDAPALTYNSFFNNSSRAGNGIAMQNYVNIYTSKGKLVTMLSLKNLEENLDQRLFIRVHKSFIVAINKIDGIEGNEIFLQTSRIPISRNYREQVIGRVITKRLWDKK